MLNHVWANIQVIKNCIYKQLTMHAVWFIKLISIRIISSPLEKHLFFTLKKNVLITTIFLISKGLIGV